MQLSKLAAEVWEVVLKVWDCKYVKFPIWGLIALIIGWMLLLMFGEFLVAWERRSNASRSRMPSRHDGPLAEQEPPVRE